MLDNLINLSPVLLSLIATLFTWFVTLLGASIVFFFKKPNRTLMDAMLGFAAGVMIAASFWSLLGPGIELAESLGKQAFLVASIGFMSGGILLFIGDKVCKHLMKKYKSEKKESFKRSIMLITSITLHNIPEGIYNLIHDLFKDTYMNNCINLKRKNKDKKYYPFCKHKNDFIAFEECKNCPYKEYKQYDTKLKQRTKKQNKKEKERFSILCKSDRCIICGNKYQLTWHEVFSGRNRSNSMRFGLCLRICLNCHKTHQENANFNEYWHKIGQDRFNEVYPDLDFIDIFKRNYL